MYSTREETSSFWRSSATILVNRSSSWIPCYTGPVMMEAFYNRFWINNGLAIDCQAIIHPGRLFKRNKPKDAFQKGLVSWLGRCSAKESHGQSQKRSCRQADSAIRLEHGT